MASSVTAVPSRSTDSAQQSVTPLVWIPAVAVFALLMAIATRYGYFRDELYYLACGEHPAWGYVDQPPVIAWVAWLLQHTIGTSLYALRLVPALAAAASVYVTAQVAREFGGGKTAQLLSAVFVAAMPVCIGVAHLFTMNIFDYVLWTAMLLVVVRIENTGEGRLWIAFGALTGITVLNKYGIVFLIIALLVAMIATPWRGWLITKHFWLGTLVACVIALPNFYWQASRHFPFLQLMHNIRHNGRDVVLGPVGFFLQQLQIVNPVTIFVVFAGLVWLLRSRLYRAIGIGFLVFYALMFVLKAKSYYLGPIYPTMFAASAVALDEWTRGTRLRWIPVAAGALAAIVFVLISPILIPVLSVPQYQAYEKKIGISQPKTEHQPEGALPQLYADMFGWPEMVQRVATFFNTLSPEQKQRTAIYAGNYGDAGAIDFFGPKYGLPKAISGHQNYWVWGPRQYSHPDVIVLGWHGKGNLPNECESVSIVGRVEHPLARPDERYDIYYCQGFKDDLQKVWERSKHWD